MHERFTYTRRQFLRSGLAMVSTVTTVPTFLSFTSSALADTTMYTTSKPGVPEDRVLVVVQLSGGNDGLNTVVPYGMRDYYRARPQLAVPDTDVLTLDDNLGIGLHPSMRGIYEMVGQRQAAVIQGVGYPNPNRSHFASMDIWHTGYTNPSGGNHGHGWIGRALDKANTLRLEAQAAQADAPADAPRTGSDTAGLECISIGSEAPLATQGRIVKPVAFERADLFRWSARELSGDLSAAYDALHLPPGPAPGSDGADDPRAFVFRTACDAQIASTRVRKAVAQQSNTEFPRSGIAQQLRSVAAMIRAELPTRVYYVAMGGFDTHANQSFAHARLLGEFSDAMKAFYGELAATGHQKRVVSLAFSEFGRRVNQNGSGGTDHGTAGPMFIFGDAITAGLRGEHPSLRNLDEGDLGHLIDFRTVYADVLESWMEMDSAAALGRRFQPARIVRA